MAIETDGQNLYIINHLMGYFDDDYQVIKKPCSVSVVEGGVGTFSVYIKYYKGSLQCIPNK